MGERKVLNKYYPPDFDLAKIPRRWQPKNQQIKVRMMLPMSIRCGTCGNYIYKGTKFNSRKEDVIGETYLGIQNFRFYFKCTKCSAEITFKTDRQNSDYIVESGASRNFEPWRAEDEVIDEEKKKRNAEEMGDVMKSLENRTLDSKREMDILAALDEMKSMKSRHATVSVDAMLEALQHSNETKERKLEEEDEALIKSVFKGPREHAVIRRIDDDEDLPMFSFDKGGTSADDSKRRKVTEEAYTPNSLTNVKGTVNDSSNSRDNMQGCGACDVGKFIFKSSSVTISILKKPLPDSNGNKQKNEEEAGPTTVASSGLQPLCQQYGSDEDD
ncbi:hypothetical protein Fot_06067 [Forsythia ovata]|uniref:Splicing factor YJU2 n=1 Tax=Forsythia ovata TaxID=205694 RepID=A0ABD1WRZ1_9LAMI